MPLSRREFLKLSAGAAASVPLSRLLLPIGEAMAATRAGTTLETTMVKGPLLGQGTRGAYYRLTSGPGEPRILRDDLGGASTASIAQSFAFVHFTDIHLIDAQSPARVEFLDRFADTQSCEQFPLSSAFRPQETLTLQVLEAMVRKVRAVRRGPVTGRPFSFVICTGDNIDNEQYNELRWFIDVLDGGKTVKPDSGGSGYEGVQAATWGDPEYWHPDPVADKYKQEYGFPNYPGLLNDAGKAFKATGLGMPWWQSFGNHDGLMQGNAPRNEEFNAIAIGPAKFTGPPPGMNPCDPFANLAAAPTRPVTPDLARRIVRRSEYIAEHFTTTGTPAGHGFTAANRTDGTAYYVRDDHPLIRFISLDTVNPGGFSEGSIGAVQFAWLEQRLIEVSSLYYDAAGNQVTTSNQDRLVILFSHHGLRSLDNPNSSPDPNEPGSNDLPRVLADEVEALLHRFPNVIAWVDGHTHNNIIDPRPDPSGRTAGFWDIGTAAHVDWICQSRVVELAIRADGTISIFCTMLDHDAPPDPRRASGVLRLAAVHRELAANDYQYGFASKGPGTPADRNVELVHPGLPWLSTAVSASGRVLQRA
jgi:metallophosphoesterase (TIGR03767 family)